MEKNTYKLFLSDFFDENTVNNLLASMEEEPLHCLRLNPLKTNNIEYFNKFEPHPYVKGAFYYNKEQFDAGNDPLHHAGAYYIQDASAMMVGKLLNVQPTDKVIDLCAAPGGKSTFVAPLLTDGLLVSNDVSLSRCQNLIENIERMGISNEIIINNEISDIASSLEGYFDKVILDAPCSGEGMFRKNSKVDEDWSREKVNKLVNIQKSLILDAYKLLKQNGIMVYSTCTFNKYENEDIINYLLENTNASLINIPKEKDFNEGINLKEALRLFPFSFKGEGHFICLIKCNDEHYCNNIKPLSSNITSKTYKIYKEFETQVFNRELDKNRLFEYNNKIYYLPSNCPNICKLHIIRQGILLGSMEKDFFKPEHHISTTLKIFKNTVKLDRFSILTQQYLHGDSFTYNLLNGYAQVQIDNIPVGLCKITNNTLKNYYPKGLRKNKID